ncbi:sulfatase-like hydrolase/transferase [Streptomyces aureus]|uniref:sulfatase-like hydrolase/transferase n=1 Tax=Streptomyces aureus TaxID=193461 RepID=UPI00369F9E07
MSFSNYYVTDSLCCPSRSSILTGQFPHNTGVFTNNGSDGGYQAFTRKGNERKCYGPAMQKAGYRTGFMGKYLNGYEPADTNGTPDTASLVLSSARGKGRSHPFGARRSAGRAPICASGTRSSPSTTAAGHPDVPPGRNSRGASASFPGRHFAALHTLRSWRIYRPYGGSPRAWLRRLTTSLTVKSHPVRRGPLQLIPTRSCSSARSGRAASRH